MRRLFSWPSRPFWICNEDHSWVKGRCWEICLAPIWILLVINDPNAIYMGYVRPNQFTHSNQYLDDSRRISRPLMNSAGRQDRHYPSQSLYILHALGALMLAVTLSRGSSNKMSPHPTSQDRKPSKALPYARGLQERNRLR